MYNPIRQKSKTANIFNNSPSNNDSKTCVFHEMYDRELLKTFNINRHKANMLQIYVDLRRYHCSTIRNLDFFTARLDYISLLSSIK